MSLSYFESFGLQSESYLVICFGRVAVPNISVTYFDFNHAYNNLLLSWNVNVQSVCTCLGGKRKPSSARDFTDYRLSTPQVATRD